MLNCHNKCKIQPICEQKKSWYLCYQTHPTSFTEFERLIHPSRMHHTMMMLELPLIGKPSWKSSSYLCYWRCSWKLQVCSFNPNSTFHPLVFIYRIILLIECEHKQKLPSHSWLHEFHLFSPSNIIIKQKKTKAHNSRLLTCFHKSPIS